MDPSTNNTNTEGRFGVAEAVYNYLNERRGLPVSLNELTRELGYSRAQVSGAISHIRNGWRLTVERPRRGMYVLTGERVAVAAAEPRTDVVIVPCKAKAEVIALVGDGRLLVSVEGTVYVATTLDLSAQ